MPGLSGAWYAEERVRGYPRTGYQTPESSGQTPRKAARLPSHCVNKISLEILSFEETFRGCDYPLNRNKFIYVKLNIV